MDHYIFLLQICEQELLKLIFNDHYKYLHLAYGFNHVHEEYYTHGDMNPHDVFLTSEYNFILQEDGTSIGTFAGSICKSQNFRFWFIKMISKFV